MADNQRTTAQAYKSHAYQYGLELDGVPMGMLSSFSGGDLTADVNVEVSPGRRIPQKSLGKKWYEDICISCGADLAGSFYDWLQQWLAGDSSMKDGTIVGYDNSGNEASRLSFSKAQVTEIGFPALDASSKDAAKLTVKISPAFTKSDSGSSQLPRALSTGAKNLTCSSFRLTIDGVAYPRVSSIEAITVGQTTSTDPGQFGTIRSSILLPSYLVVPDVIFTFEDLSTDPATNALRSWFDSFVVQGKSTQDEEKNGTLEYLSSDLKTVLFRLDLRQLGVYRLSALNDGSSNGGIPRTQARLYCEQILLNYGSNAVIAGTPISLGSTTSTVSVGTGSQGAGQPANVIPSRSLGNVTVLQGQSSAFAKLGASTSVSSQPSRAVVSAVTQAQGNRTAAQGPRNLAPLQENVLVPSPQPRTSLVFRNLSN